MKKYIDELKKLVQKALKYNEVPVAALVVKSNQIIAKAYNKRNKTNNVLDHAEIICITKASKKLRSWRLNDCDMYVTMKPCKMCEQVIKESRIKKVYFLLENEKTKLNNEKLEFILLTKDYTKEYLKIIQNFFDKKRY